MKYDTRSIDYTAHETGPFSQQFPPDQTGYFGFICGCYSLSDPITQYRKYVPGSFGYKGAGVKSYFGDKFRGFK